MPSQGPEVFVEYGPFVYSRLSEHLIGISHPTSAERLRKASARSMCVNHLHLPVDYCYGDNKFSLWYVDLVFT